MREVESGQEELYYNYPVISLESALVSWQKNMWSFRFYFIFLSYSTKHFDADFPKLKYTIQL